MWLLTLHLAEAPGGGWRGVEGMGWGREEQRGVERVTFRPLMNNSEAMPS